MRNKLARTSLLPALLLALASVAAQNAQGQRPDPSTFYAIVGRQGGKCLRALDGARDNGIKIVGDRCDMTSDSQQWQISEAGDGYYKVVSKSSRRALDVLGGAISMHDGAVVGQWDYNGHSHQAWEIALAEDSPRTGCPSFECFYKITARHSTRSLDLPGGPFATRAVAQQWKYWGGANQQWRLIDIRSLQAPPSASLTPATGRFRVTLTGFVVNHDTSEHALTIDGAGDEVFALANFAELRSTSNLSELLQRRQSVLYGDTSGRGGPHTLPGTVLAGSASHTGGLRTGDSYPPRGESPVSLPGASVRDRLIPMVLWEGELRRGGPRPNAAVIIPTIWENDHHPEVLNIWQQAVDTYILRLSVTGAGFINGSASRPVVEQSETVLSTIPQSIDFDRPIGMEGGTFNPFGPSHATFMPAVMFLTFNSATEAASSTSNSSTRGRGVVEITYRDGGNYGPGSYTLFVLVERLL